MATVELSIFGVPSYRWIDARKRQLAMADAVAVCGPNRHGYGCWTFIDKSEAEPHLIVFCASDGDGRGWQPSAQSAIGVDRYLERLPGTWEHIRPASGAEFCTLGLMRWEVHFGSIELYKPQTTQQMDDARTKREQKRVSAEVAAAPLFATSNQER